MVRRLLAVVTCALALAACRVDAVVVVEMAPDGTGTVTVTVTTDADVVAQVPGLAGDLRFDDAVAAGWVVTGPAATEEGGLEVGLTHTFSGAAEATNLLASLGAPFSAMSVTRVVDGDTATNTLDGSLGGVTGFESFADADLLAAIGGAPFADEIAAAAATPAGSMSVNLQVTMPGTITETTGTQTGAIVEWSAPLDGSTTSLRTIAVQEPESGSWWARPLATAALIAFVVWIVGSVGFLLWAAVERRRRARRALAPRPRPRPRPGAGVGRR